MADQPLSSRAAKAFDFAQETAKQLITLSTGVFALTFTFVKDIAPKHADTTQLHRGWGCYLLSIVLGILTLMSLAGNLERPNVAGQDSIYATNIKVLAGGQILAFLAGLGFTLWFGIHVT